MKTKAHLPKKEEELPTLLPPLNHAAPTNESSEKSSLANETEFGPLDPALEPPNPSAAWGAIPGSGGRQVAEYPTEDDEDEEGRNETAQLVTDGVAHAEKEQIQRAAAAASRQESEESPKP